MTYEEACRYMALPMDSEELSRLIMRNNHWIHGLILDLERISIQEQPQLQPQPQPQHDHEHEHHPLLPGQFTQNQIRKTFEQAGHVSQCDSPNCRVLRCHAWKETLAAMTHATQCPKDICGDTNCSKIKSVYRHGIWCKKLAEERCYACRVLWFCLMIHARVCTDSICRVPCCRVLKQHLLVRGLAVEVACSSATSSVTGSGANPMIID